MHLHTVNEKFNLKYNNASLQQNSNKKTMQTVVLPHLTLFQDKSSLINNSKLK